MDWKKISKDEKNRYIIPNRWIFIHYYEALNLLFRIENAVRIFVYIILKNELSDKWIEVQIANEEDSNEGTIGSIAKKRIKQSRSFGYLGHSISCPIMYLTSGELIRLIVSNSYWKYFKEYFFGNKEIVRNKFEEIGSIRNSLAHFRTIKQEAIGMIKQNSKHMLMGIEQLFSQVLTQHVVTPTNTQDSWYKKLRVLGTDICLFSITQSKNEQWIRLTIQYNCPILVKKFFYDTVIYYKILNIKSSEILKKYASLKRNITYLSEIIPFTTMGEEYTPNFSKIIIMVFNRKILEEKYDEIKADIENLLNKISEETDLIKDDNLARGEIINSVEIGASSIKENNGIKWIINTEVLRTLVSDKDPAEYWGSFGLYSPLDFISGTNLYPWMPEDVSYLELPF
ncbi:MAG TPA: hypothetical protein ENO18_01685 [Caldithrix sp.]|nr:hypothetical protein [Caldithrix sp.]